MDSLVDFVPLVATLALAAKVVDWLKYIKDKNTNGTVTQALAWLAGVGVIFLLANSDFGGGVVIADQALSALGWESLVLIGLTVGSSGSLAFDFKKALDNTDSAATPQIFDH